MSDQEEFDRRIDSTIRCGWSILPASIGLGAALILFCWLRGIEPEGPFVAAFVLFMIGPVTVISALWWDIMFNPRWKRRP